MRRRGNRSELRTSRRCLTRLDWSAFPFLLWFFLLPFSSRPHFWCFCLIQVPYFQISFLFLVGFPDVFYYLFIPIFRRFELTFESISSSFISYIAYRDFDTAFLHSNARLFTSFQRSSPGFPSTDFAFCSIRCCFLYPPASSPSVEPPFHLTPVNLIKTMRFQRRWCFVWTRYLDISSIASTITTSYRFSVIRK